MAWDRKLYPKNWEEMSRQIKEAANWHCQECGKPCRKTGESTDRFLSRVTNMPAEAVRSHPQKWVLTVAHLNHDPADSSPDNLKPLCVPCHARLDIRPSAMAQKQHLKRERLGQLKLLLS